MEKGQKETLEEHNLRTIRELEERESAHLIEKSKTRNLADAKELLDYANIKKKLEIPTLGFFVEYMPLRISDRIQINEIKHSNPDVQVDLKNRETLFLLLNRVNPDVYTREYVEKMPAAFIDAILLEYTQKEDDRFLLPIIARKLNGLTRIPTHSA